MAFIGFSQNPELSKKVNFFGALAPVARITHVEGFFKALDYIEPEAQKLFEILGIHDFFPSGWFMDAVADLVCDTNIITALFKIGTTDYQNKFEIFTFRTLPY